MAEQRINILVYRPDGTMIAQYLLGDGEHLIGRDINCPVYLDTEYISSNHAKLYLSHDGIQIEDLNSTSGTYLDGVTVRGKLRIKPGQVLQVGDLTVHLQPESEGKDGPGSRLGDGRYTLVRMLGKGGMGEVWLAKDEQLDEEVALKRLPSEVGADAMALNDMRREVQKSRALSHPNIIRIHDLIQQSGEDPLISLEYVDGTDLTAIAATKTNGIFDWSDIQTWVLQLVDALDYAHEEKIVHRDLKPGNIMISRRGRLKLADFGIAATVADATRRSSMEGFISGTTLYMSPQQMEGRAPCVTDDIYAFGATIYELLTSRPPFYTGNVEHQVINVTPTPPSQRLAEFGFMGVVPPYLQELVMACLAKEPEGRPQTMGAIRQWIQTEGKATGVIPKHTTKTIKESAPLAKPVGIAEEPAPDQRKAKGGIPAPVIYVVGVVLIFIFFIVGKNCSDGKKTEELAQVDNNNSVSELKLQPVLEVAIIENLESQGVKKTSGQIIREDLGKVWGLTLRGPEVTDSTIDFLLENGLGHLTNLALFETQVSDLGNGKLNQFKKLKKIDFRHNQFTALSWKEVGKVKSLTYINIKSDAQTVGWMNELQKALPDCEIWYNSKKYSAESTLSTEKPTIKLATEAEVKKILGSYNKNSTQKSSTLSRGLDRIKCNRIVFLDKGVVELYSKDKVLLKNWKFRPKGFDYFGYTSPDREIHVYLEPQYWVILGFDSSGNLFEKFDVISAGNAGHEERRTIGKSEQNAYTKFTRNSPEAAAAIEAAIRKAAGKPVGSLTKGDKEKIKVLSLENSQISDLAPFSVLYNLEELHLNQNLINDLHPIRNLKNLQRLSLNNNRVVDISPIKGLTKLYAFHISNNNLTSEGSRVRDLSALKELNLLRNLGLGNNHYIKDLKPLSGLSALEKLNLSGNMISDTDLLKDFKNLKGLNLHNNDGINDAQVQKLKSILPNCMITYY